MSEELEPCPLCRSTEVSVSTGWKGTSKRFYVECEVCECMAGMWETKANAIAAWNTRHADKELVKALEEICGTTCVDGYGKVIEIADAALAKYKGV